MRKNYKIEEYIAERKKEDKINEFDRNARNENIKACVDYVFEYFNNYLESAVIEESTILHNEKLDRYRKELKDYDDEVEEWLVAIYHKHGNQLNRYIKNILKEEELFLLYDSDREFRKVSYDCYAELVKKLPFLQDETEMLFKYIKDYHRVVSQWHADQGFPIIIDFVDEWVEKTWLNYRVNLAAFANNYVIFFYDYVDLWPPKHRVKNPDHMLRYDYDYKQKSNLFNLDSLYRKMPKKSFIKGRKQQFEVLLMYYWLHEIKRDDDYWNDYLKRVTSPSDK